MKITFNSVGDLPLKKTLVLHEMVAIVRSVFRENKKYYPKVFFDN